MRGKPWKDQIEVGRVFELRSTSKRYPPPCALIIRKHWTPERQVIEVDRRGCVGEHLYSRRPNPKVYLYSLDYVVKRIARRRPDLERFGLEDLELIRYGLDVDFSGRLHGHGEQSIPLVWPATWTVFWIPAYAEHDNGWLQLWTYEDEWKRLIHGAWHFDNHGGHKRLGYKYGRMWATCHTGERLRRIREFLRGKLSGVIEQTARVVRWEDARGVHTASIHRPSPPLWACGGMSTEFHDGNHGYTTRGLVA